MIEDLNGLIKTGELLERVKKVLPTVEKKRAETGSAEYDKDLEILKKWKMALEEEIISKIKELKRLKEQKEKKNVFRQLIEKLSAK